MSGRLGQDMWKCFMFFLQPFNKHVIASSETNVNRSGSQPLWAEGIKQDNSGTADGVEDLMPPCMGQAEEASDHRTVTPGLPESLRPVQEGSSQVHGQPSL